GARSLARRPRSLARSPRLGASRGASRRGCALREQRFSVMPEVILHERRDEVVAVVVLVVAAEPEALPRLGAGLLEQVGLELRVEELVGHPLVDEDLVRKRAARPDQLGRVVLRPLAAVGAEVARERLLSPGHA